GSVGAYVAQVDRVLSAGVGLFPEFGGGSGRVDGGGPAVPGAPPGGRLQTGVEGAAGSYRQGWTGVSGLDADTNTAAADGRSAGEQGRGGASGVRDSARSQAAAIAPATGTPAGSRLMVSTMDERLAAMQQQIDTTKAQNKLLAARLRQVAQAYRASAAMGGGGRGMMGGMGMPSFGGGGMPTGGGGGGGIPGLNALSSLSALGGRNGSATRSVSSIASGRALADGPLPPGKASEDRLQRNTIRINRAVSAAFPEIQKIGGYRQDSLHWHPDGLALDIMIPNPTSPAGIALGNRVVEFLQTNRESLGVDHTIWRQQIDSGSGPKLMGDRGGMTANHFDHVHVASTGGGYP
ncbi:hypothetical protein, partial [Mycobacterium sp. NPDC004974]